MRKLKRKLKLNYKLIIVIIIVAFFFIISIGYSYLQTQLKIEGKATITPQEKNVVYPKGNSSCVYKIENISVQNNSNYKSYNVILNLVNNDEDAYIWNIEFDIPNSAKNIKCDLDYTLNNGRMKIIYKTENEIIQKGSTKTINFKADLKEEEKFSIKNLTLNGLLVDINLQ